MTDISPSCHTLTDSPSSRFGIAHVGVYQAVDLPLYSMAQRTTMWCVRKSLARVPVTIRHIDMEIPIRDGILVPAAVPVMSRRLIKQLAEGERLTVGICPSTSQESSLVVKRERLTTQRFFNANWFARLLGHCDRRRDTEKAGHR